MDIIKFLLENTTTEQRKLLKKNWINIEKWVCIWSFNTEWAMEIQSTTKVIKKRKYKKRNKKYWSRFISKPNLW